MQKIIILDYSTAKVHVFNYDKNIFESAEEFFEMLYETGDEFSLNFNNCHFMIYKYFNTLTMEFYRGSIRIKKASTLQSWIDKGWFQRELDNGYTFAPGCGRFRIGKCECSICRKPNSGLEKKAVLKRNNLLN